MVCLIFTGDLLSIFSMNKKEVGNFYEDIACEYFVNLGYTILDRNYYFRHLEIDIIALDSDTNDLVFAEVKYRKDDKFGGANFAITKQKIQNLRKAALGYMKKNGYKIDSFVRFDCILITGDKIEHIKNAW